jgi:hypothetical protein
VLQPRKLASISIGDIHIWPSVLIINMSDFID